MSASTVKTKQLLHTELECPLNVYLYNSAYLLGVKTPYTEELIGSLADTAVTDPAASEASALALLRGMLTKITANSTPDIADRAARLLGHVTVDNSDYATQTTLASVLSKLQTGVSVTFAGNITTATHTTVSVLATTTAVIAANASRRYLLLVNDSASNQYVSLGANAVLHQGILLNANGGSYEMSAANGNLFTGAINAISSVTGNLLVTEGV